MASRPTTSRSTAARSPGLAWHPNFARISVRLSTSQQAAEQVAACASVPSFRRSAVHPDLRQAWQAVGGFQSYAWCHARLLVLTGTVIRAKFGYLVFAGLTTADCGERQSL